LVSTSLEYLDALAEICQLFLRRTTNRRIASSGSQWSPLAEHLFQKRVGNQVQRLDVETRREVVRSASEALANWPRAFLDFTQATGLSEVHFSESLPELPRWMAQLIDEDLRRQRRGITAIDVERQVAELQKDGRPINAAEVERAFGVSQAKAINARLGRRTEATASELNELLSNIRACVHPTGMGMRRASTASAARSAVVILLAIFAGKETRDVAEASECELETLLLLVKDCGDQVALISCLEHCLTINRACRPLAIKCAHGQRDGRAFSLCRGTGSVRRSAQEFLRSAMSGLDPRLRRSPAVFKRAFE
jgi:hypothetical protein